MRCKIFRKIFNGTLGFIAVTAITAILLEGAARLFDGVSLTRVENFVASELSRGMHVGSNRHDSTLGWVLRENSGSGGFRTREHGLRVNIDTNDPLDPLMDGAVVVVGDSFAAGSEVTNQHSWPAYIERKSGKPVYNGGVGGYGVDQIFLRGKSLNAELKPKILLLGILTDDSLRNSYRIYGGGNKPYYDLGPDGELILKGVPVKYSPDDSGDVGWTRAIFGYSYFLYFAAKRLGKLEKWVNPKLRYKLNVPQKAGPAITCALLRKIPALEKETGVDVAFVVQYGGPEVLAKKRHWFGQEVIDCAKEIGIDLIDTYPALLDVLEREGVKGLQRLYVMHNDNTVYGHMSPEGNELTAKVIMRAFGSRISDLSPKPF